MDTLKRILGGVYPDPDGGAPLNVPTRAVVIENSLAGQEDILVRDLNIGQHFAVVSDPQTAEVLGTRVARALRSGGEVTEVRLPAEPHADQQTAQFIREESKAADALIAVGSGTINDLCKYAAAGDNKPYAVFGTAPSMNGYTSVNAAITVEGHKKSLPATAPIGVFLDLKVLSEAPPRMIRSGLGDSLCRPTAQWDWLMASLLLGDQYREAPFVLLAEEEEALFAEPEALFAGDLEAMGRLARTLVYSGFGMTVCGGSYPASQGEHLISHYVEMMGRGLPDSFHGEQIGVATLTMAELQESLLENGPPRLQPSQTSLRGIVTHFGVAIGSACWREFEKKWLEEEDCDQLNHRLATEWDSIAGRLSRVMIPPGDLRKTLRRAGAPTCPADLGWTNGFYADAFRHAREIRNRYTALDLAADSGQLDDFAALLEKAP